MFPLHALCSWHYRIDTKYTIQNAISKISYSTLNTVNQVACVAQWLERLAP
jgi:hypothetical protein